MGRRLVGEQWVKKNPLIEEVLPKMSEATTGFEPVMKLLQSLALPLGDVAE